MKQYIQYYTELTRDKSKIVEALGSDGYCPLDGRLSLKSCINIAMTRKNFRNYTKWAIHKGDLKRSRIICKNFKESISEPTS